MALYRRIPTTVEIEFVPPGGNIATHTGRIVTEDGDGVVTENGVSTFMRAAEIAAFYEPVEEEEPEKKPQRASRAKAPARAAAVRAPAKDEDEPGDDDMHTHPTLGEQYSRAGDSRD